MWSSALIDHPLVQSRSVAVAKIRPGLIVAGHAPQNPPIDIMLLAEPFDLASGTAAFEGGLHPQQEQDFGIVGVATGRTPPRWEGSAKGGAFDRLDRLRAKADDVVGSQGLIESASGGQQSAVARSQTKFGTIAHGISAATMA